MSTPDHSIQDAASPTPSPDHEPEPDSINAQEEPTSPKVNEKEPPRTLLTLPFEIRSEIFSYAVGSPYFSLKNLGKKRHDRDYIAMQNTCRQLYAETSLLQYETATFKLSPIAADIHTLLPAHVLPRIKYLRIDVDFMRKWANFAGIENILANCLPALQTVTIYGGRDWLPNAMLEDTEIAVLMMARRVARGREDVYIKARVETGDVYYEMEGEELHDEVDACWEELMEEWDEEFAGM